MTELNLTQAKNYTQTNILKDYSVEEIQELWKWSYGKANVIIYKVKTKTDYYLLRTINSSDADDLDKAKKLQESYQECEKLSNHLLKTLGVETKEGVMETLYECSNKNLASILASSNIEDVIRRMKEILGPLALLEQKNIFNLDLNPNNIFDVNGTTKIVDLGKSLASCNIKTENNNPYLPPEVNSGTTPDFSKIDVYSWGVIFYQLLTGKTEDELVIEKKNCNEFVNELKESKVLDRESWVIEALKEALAYSPEKRETFAKLKAISDSNKEQSLLYVDKLRYERVIKQLKNIISRLERDKGTFIISTDRKE